jgi:hypothetical protein
MMTTTSAQGWRLVLLAIGLTLPGPAMAQSTPPATEYDVAGRAAWEEAGRRGFEFFPVIPGDAFILTGERDGAKIALKACPATGGSCAIEAQVLEGEMIVLPPSCEGCTRHHVFEMFAGRLLAPGWSLKGVQIQGSLPNWVRAPRQGVRDPSFALRLEARAGVSAAAAIERITLLGPPDSDWRQAFATGGR